MQIALAQIDYHVGNIAFNTEKIINAISLAETKGAELVVFSELAVCGYPPKDLLFDNDFINKTIAAINTIAQHCTKITAIVGGPSRNPRKNGKKLFNTAFVLENGKIKHTINKTLLPTYDVFEENRYFEPNNTFETVEIRGKKIALTICEDLWSNSNLYTISPLKKLYQQNPQIIINIAASPFSYTHLQTRTSVLVNNAKTYQLPIIYVNQVGANTDLVFDGNSMVVNSNGEIVTTLKAFEEDIAIIDTQNLTAQKQKNELHTVENIYHALVLGIKDFFKKQNFQKAIIGLSGGIDSAVTLVLAADALGKENVKAVLLPSPYSTQHSVQDAITLSDNLGCEYDIIKIDETYQAFLNTLKNTFNDLPFDTTEENIQARCRGIILMAMSNKFGYILLNTTNKSEMAVGYGTLYGDMCGAISVLGDVYKTEVYQLAHFINRFQTIIPNHIITKAPSAELRPNQKDSDSLPDYEILDKILKHYIDEQKGLLEIITACPDIEQKLIERVIKMVNQTEYKRKQAPPVIRISNKAFGEGRKMPLVMFS